MGDMTEESTDDWTTYSVSNSTMNGCVQLDTVSHVTHIRKAVEITRNRCIRSQLIYDKSRLNKKRILVVWLSPNDWSGAGGFRYGNVAFDFDIKSLVLDKRFYWVGVMKYSPHACRILITDQDRDKLLKPYDPSLGDGPWHWDKAKDEHWWNGSYCLEFMYEGDLPLDDAKEIRFVKHHADRCSINPYSCGDRGLSDCKGGSIYLATIAAEGLVVPDHLFPGDHGDDKVMTELQGPWSYLYRALTNMPVDATSSLSPQDRAAYARAIFGALARRDRDEAECFSKLFRSHKRLVKSCAALLNDALQLEGIRELPTTDE